MSGARRRSKGEEHGGEDDTDQDGLDERACNWLACDDRGDDPDGGGGTCGHGVAIEVIEERDWPGRYIPIVRTLMSPLAGILKMDKKKFTFWNSLSALLWTSSILIIGFLLGERVSGSIDKYLLPIVLTLILVSMIPVLRELLKKKK